MGGPESHTAGHDELAAQLEALRRTAAKVNAASALAGVATLAVLVAARLAGWIPFAGFIAAVAVVAVCQVGVAVGLISRLRRRAPAT